MSAKKTTVKKKQIPQYSTNKGNVMSSYPEEEFFDVTFQNFKQPETGIDAQLPMNSQGIRSRSPMRSKSPLRHEIRQQQIGQTTQVSFSLFYETRVGESLCVLGST